MRVEREKTQMRIKAILLTMLLIIGAMTVGAQTADAPIMPDKNRADILAIELRMSQEQSQYNNLKAQMDQLGESFQKDVVALQLAESDACKAAKADCEKEWSVDAQSVKFIKKPTPQPQTPPPQAKK
jgi:hypothetical protein